MSRRVHDLPTGQVLNEPRLARSIRRAGAAARNGFDGEELDPLVSITALGVLDRLAMTSVMTSIQFSLYEWLQMSLGVRPQAEGRNV